MLSILDEFDAGAYAYADPDPLSRTLIDPLINTLQFRSRPLARRAPILPARFNVSTNRNNRNRTAP
ncbi:hypothetical protein PQR14_00610 [Paraburkholderia bryophila]|uniref:hypothetical protein n=1 Tax=Burkholderiaceae TaxID=119060 RepID=UPI0012E0B776|nr:hypothetical protein [Burkholderia sp. 9120]